MGKRSSFFSFFPLLLSTSSMDGKCVLSGKRQIPKQKPCDRCPAGSACVLGCWKLRVPFYGHCTGPGRICDFFPVTVSRSILLQDNRVSNTPFFSELTNFSYVILHSLVALVLLLTHAGIDAPPPGRASLCFVIMWLLLLILLGNTPLKGTLCFISSCASIQQVRKL